MTKRQQDAYERMTPEQQATVDRIRAEHTTREHRAEERRVRELVENEIPPKVRS